MYKPISNYGLIGDMNSAALVSSDGSIDWCCLPRFDSPSVFAALLDDSKGGRFRITPSGPYHVRQKYLQNTAVLETCFVTPTGEVQLLDFMPLSITGNTDHEICRIVTCTHGEVVMNCLFQPAFDYARVKFNYEVGASGALAKNGKYSMSFVSDMPQPRVEGDALVSTFQLKQGERTSFMLRYGSWPLSSLDIHEVANKLETTSLFWKDKVRELKYNGPWSEAVYRSSITLHLLMYAPTGAIVAAPTTSLPEELGGERNWDYRFCWLRDSVFAMDILCQLGDTQEASKFLGWLADFCRRYQNRTPAVTAVDFQSPLAESRLTHLNGYRNSSPVRIGNGAARQLQLDVFGEIMLLASTLHRIGGGLAQDMWPIFRNFVSVALNNHQRRDRSIWEVRGDRHHFVFSKMMCWVALDRGIHMAQELGQGQDIVQWQRARDSLKEEILSRGWCRTKESFVQHYASQECDASLLLMPLVKFLPGDDTRIQKTVYRIIQELSDDGMVYRYRPKQSPDGLPGNEGAFTMLSFWLVDCLVYAGYHDQAAQLFERLLGYTNHLGLLSEMIDPTTKEFLGNFPQAITHIALMHSARHLSAVL